MSLLKELWDSGGSRLVINITLLTELRAGGRVADENDDNPALLMYKGKAADL